jgi:hypothetical protein
MVAGLMMVMLFGSDSTPTAVEKVITTDSTHPRIEELWRGVSACR